MNLTPHFTLKELTDSQKATRLGIDNTPNDTERRNLLRVATTLEQVRALYGRPVVISSGFRSIKLNAATPGSSDTSAHCKGLAADFIIPGISVRDVCRRISESSIVFDQLIYEGAWVHVGLSDAAPRRQVLTAHFNGGPKPTYTVGIA